MSRIVIAGTPSERQDALSVRLAVFVEEQRIPREEEIDALDDTAIHCVGYEDEVPVAAGRLVVIDAQDTAAKRYGKIGRMAVLKERRGTHLGGAVLAALEREGRALGLSRFQLSAQLTARGFYERNGYTAYGDVYDDVGIPHIDMEKAV